MYEGKGRESEVNSSGPESLLLTRMMNLRESPGGRRPEEAVWRVRTTEEEVTDVTTGVEGMVGTPAW